MGNLGEYVNLQRGNTYKGALLGLPGPVLLGLASIQRNGGFRSDNLKTYGGVSDPRMLLEPGDIFVSLKDVTQSADLLGSVSRVPATVSQGRLTQDTVRLIFRGENPPKEYIYWVLRTPQYREYCRAHATGTTNLGLPRDDFLAFPIPDPTSEKKELAGVLQALDDKIDLNRRMNETLEAMARAVFKDWFADFGPVRAKAEGRQPPGLSPDIAALFPDALDDEDKPLGWPTGTLLDLCELKRGYDLPSAQRMPGPYPIVSSSGISGRHVSSMAEGPGVVTGRYGTVGEVYFINGAYWPLNTALYVRNFKGNEPRFIFHALKQIDFQQYSDKAAVPGVNRNHLHQAPILLVPGHIQAAYVRFLGPMWQRQESNEAENSTLAQLRDLLLPKLMSGGIRLKNAEKAVEAVA